MYAREVVKVGGGGVGGRAGRRRARGVLCLLLAAWFAQRIRRWLWLAVVVVSVRV